MGQNHDMAHLLRVHVNVLQARGLPRIHVPPRAHVQRLHLHGLRVPPPCFMQRW